tara:strand:+ start:68 stop:472 length:405 start_codon:yes stop_codon:yes gene_type:complete
MSFNLKKWKELPPNEKFNIELILALLHEDAYREKMEMTPEEIRKRNKINASRNNIVVNFTVLLLIGILLTPVYFILEIPVKRLLRSEEMYEYFWCLNNNRERWNHIFDQMAKGIDPPPNPPRRWSMYRRLDIRK